MYTHRYRKVYVYFYVQSRHRWMENLCRIPHNNMMYRLQNHRFHFFDCVSLRYPDVNEPKNDILLGKITQNIITLNILNNCMPFAQKWLNDPS